MSEFTPRLGSFTAYLESTRKDKSEAAAAPVSPITVLEILSRQPQRAMAMADLEKLSGMDSTRFRSVLKSLVDLAYVTVEGPALEAAVTLTDKGAEAAVLARPA
jgi:predicted transcriptional regulator